MLKETLCTVLLVAVARAANILGVFMTPSYSHQVVFQPIWRELSLRGHKVTVFTPNPINDPSLTNLTEIDLSFSYNVWNKKSAVLSRGRRSLSEDFELVLTSFGRIFEAQMSSPEMQDLISNRNNQSYDLFLVEYLYAPMYGFKDVYKCPMVGISSLPLTIGSTNNLGMYRHPALDPDMYLPFSTNLSFKERILSTAFYLLYKLKIAVATGPMLESKARKYFGRNSKSVVEIATEVSLVLGNSNFATNNIRPTVPAFIDLVGIHLQPEKPLPNDLKKMLDEAKEGVIYFSLGTNVNLKHVPHQMLKAFYDAFSELPYKVLCKSKDNVFRNLSNVKTSEWFPQQDVLRHPNVKLFIMQGGLQSIDEAIVSETPMLIIPFYGDQYSNAQKMTSSGIALSLNVDNVSKHELVGKIKELILDPKYRNATTKMKGITFDQPISALDKAVWWIEYVLKHDGAPHLKYKAVGMPFYQYHLLDVYLFLATLAYIVFYILVKIFKRLITGFYFCYKTLQSIGVIRANSKKSQ